jgi:hypothetical protein
MCFACFAALGMLQMLLAISLAIHVPPEFL